jgi:hypothetical protein
MTTDGGWDGSSLSLNDDLIRAAAKETQRKRKHAPKNPRFVLGGLITMEWLQRAWSVDRGQYVLRAALVIRHLEALNRGRRTSFTLTNSEAARWGISRQMKYPLIKKLERAGLIAVRRRRGCALLITVIEVPAKNT